MRVTAGPTPHRYEALAAVIAGSTLLALAPRPAQAARLLAGTVSSHDRWTDPTAPVLGLVCLVAWLLAGWLVLAALILLAVRLPGLSGRVAAAVAVRVVPPAVRRCLEVVVGASLALTTVAALPAVADGPGAAATPTASDSLDWPTLPATGRPVRTTPTASTARGPAGSSPAAAAPARAGQVLVAPGDTLWALAERSLQARGRAAPSAAAIAVTWPSWWAANREVIGDDPDLLLPGTPLRSP